MEKEPIRVLQVVTIMDRGGLETMLMNYYRHIDRSRTQFDFMVHRQERGAYDDEIESLGGRIYRMPPIRPQSLFQYFTALDMFFKEHKEYQIVHSHLDLLSTFVLRYAKLNGVPVRIAHSHNTNISDRGARKIFKLMSRSQLARYCTHKFACSCEAGKYLFGQHVPENKIFVMKNAIDTDNFRFDSAIREKIRRELGLSNYFVVGHVGRFEHQKNHAFLLDIFFEIQQQEPKARLMLIGEGSLKEDIMSRSERLGIRDKVLFLGALPNVNEYMMAMDIFVFPSRYEGLGIVAVEAQAAGLPVIASSGIPQEIVLTTFISFLPLSAGEKKWSEAIFSLRSADRNENGYVKIIETYGIRQNTERLTATYEEMLHEDHRIHSDL